MRISSSVEEPLSDKVMSEAMVVCPSDFMSFAFVNVDNISVRNKWRLNINLYFFVF